MKPAASNHLSDLARTCGVQAGYINMTGKRHDATPEAIVATLEALGVRARSPREIQQSLCGWHERHWTRGIEPVIVAWDQKPFHVGLHLPRQRNTKNSRCLLRMENGTEKILPIIPKHQKLLAEARVNGRDYVAIQVALPALPLGYHHLELEVGNQTHRSLIISAPTRGFSRRGVRDWGAFLPMYAAHSKRSWGAGNFSDWDQLCAWIGSLGGKIVGTLPLLAAFLDFPTCDPSPYSPASRLFWNEFYLDIERVPEFAECPIAQKLVNSAAFQKRLNGFRNAPLVDYKAEWSVRRKILEMLADCFLEQHDGHVPSRQSRRAEFERFVREHPQAEDYARFRAACDQRKTSWHNWPERMRAGRLRAGDYDEATKNFHLYVQWLAQAQINQLIGNCRKRGVQFYLDLPLGVHPDGYDVWRERDCFAIDAKVGAPPDNFFTEGQDWGFAPLHPQRIREQGYRHVIDYLRFQMRHTGLLRIDHVMGLHRLYWIPRGFSPKQGVYVNYPAEELHAILSLESHRNKTMLVGENLGTVPPEVNESMKRHGLLEMFIVQYEQRQDAKAALRTPPQRSVASLNTHDMPTFAAHWLGLEIADHASLGLVPKHQIAAKRAARKTLNKALAGFLRQQGTLKTKADLASVLRACLLWLGRSPAEIVLVNLEDLMLEKLPQNVPGTYMERPNWRRRARLTLEQIFKLESPPGRS